MPRPSVIYVRLTPAEARAIERLRTYTRTYGKHISTQKIIILLAFLRLRRSATIEQVRAAAKRKISNIGYATVYRALLELTRAGLADRESGRPFRFKARKKK